MRRVDGGAKELKIESINLYWVAPPYPVSEKTVRVKRGWLKLESHQTPTYKGQAEENMQKRGGLGRSRKEREKNPGITPGKHGRPKSKIHCECSLAISSVNCSTFWLQSDSFLCFVCLVVCFWDRIFCSPRCSQTPFVAKEGGLKLILQPLPLKR